MPFDRLHLEFFDRWLKDIDNGVEGEPHVRMYVMGANAWREEEQWPPADAALVPIYLDSAGKANTIAGNGVLAWEKPAGDAPSDRFTYDPDDPTPSHADLTEWLVDGDFPLLDNRWRLDREDVLVYTSDPLAEDLEISGHPFVVLHAASDCPDTDWHVTFCDVLPDGRSDELSSGCLRAAYRDGLDAPPTPIEPGRVYEFRIELRALSNLWKKGHRLRVTVASANYPESARNPNTNARPGDDEEWRVAHNTVWHTPKHPSHLLAPVVRR
jgi:putative CocE/NonD family hydrolase